MGCVLSPSLLSCRVIIDTRSRASLSYFDPPDMFLCRACNANVLFSTDEAGFDVLIGSEDSRIPSQLYTEKVHVLSKAFIKTALTSPPQGLEDVIKWLYLTSTQPSPHLLRRVVKDSESSLAKSHCGMTVNGARDMQNEDASGRPNLSAGALVLLKRNLVWLKDLLERDEGN